MSNAHNHRPPLFQYSIGTALLVMAWVALVCIAITTKTPLWLNIIGLVTILGLLSAVLVAIYGERESRAFAVGFALFGFLFLVGLNRFDSYSPRLLSRYLGESAFQIKNREAWSRIASAIATRTTADQRLIEERNRFIEISQSTAVITAAWFGGILARYLHRKRPRPE